MSFSMEQVTGISFYQEQEELRKARAHLRNLQVEQVYYALQEDPLKGFEAYSRIAEEAFQSNEFRLWLLLRDELRFVECVYNCHKRSFGSLFSKLMFTVTEVF